MRIFRKKEKIVNDKVDILKYDIDDGVQKTEKVCDVCGNLNSYESKFCKKCKISLENIICPVCGESNNFDQKYCVNCDSILQNKRRR